MATNFIGAGQTFTTLQEWEDFADTTLTEPWIGKIKSASDIFSGSTTMLTMQGSTSSSSNYKELTTDDGASFVDNLDPEVDALKYDESKGCAITSSVGGYTVNLDEDFARISKIQVKNTSSGVTGIAIRLNQPGVLASQMIGYCTSGGGSESRPLSMFRTCKINSSLLIQGNSGANQLVSIGYGAAMYNCTVVSFSDITAATVGVGTGYSSPIMKNVALFNAVNFNNNFTPTCTTCLSDAGTLPTGVAEEDYSTAGFINTTVASHDYRIGDASPLKNSGTYDATNAPIDILGRPFSDGNTAIGAFNIVAVSSGPPIPVLVRFGGVDNLAGYIQG